MIAALIAIFAASAILTGYIRRYCLAHGIVDIPNQRSSHNRIVARGGGVGFTLIFLVAVSVLGASRLIPVRTVTAILGGGSLVALTGWLDDRKGLSARIRIVCHFAASLWAVLWIGPILSHWAPLWMLTAAALSTVSIVWMVNLYNFMDGTDGLAGTEAITVAVAAGAFCYLGQIAALGFAHEALAAAVAGFLVWNWPPARIFMGDAGSGFLGFAFGTLNLWCVSESSRMLWPCLILLAIFIADATTTLIRRIARGEKWYEAHRSHAFQKLSRRYGHLPVAVGTAVINLFLLIPAAWLAWKQPQYGLPLTAIVYAVMIAVVLVVRDRESV